MFFYSPCTLREESRSACGLPNKNVLYYLEKFQVYIVPLRCFLVSTDVISFWISVQARYNWPGGVAYGCCERKLQRRLNWLLAILLLNTKMFIFLLLLTFDLSGGQKKGQRIIVPISTPVTKCFGFYRRPWGHGSGGSSGPPSVTYVGKQPLPRLQCSNSLPSRSKQNLLRVASVKSTFLAEKNTIGDGGDGGFGQMITVLQRGGPGNYQDLPWIWGAKLGISSLHTNNVLLFMRVKMGKHFFWEVKWLQKNSADPKVWQTTRQTWAGDMWLACQKFPVQRYILYRNFNAVRWYFLENSMGTLNTSLSESFLLMSALSPL